MTPVSQIVWRNRHRFDGQKRLLLVRPPADDLASQLHQAGVAAKALCHSYASHKHLSSTGIDSEFAVIHPVPELRWPQVVLFQPREKDLLEMMLDLCGGLLDKEGHLWLAGENRSGIKSAGKRLTGRFESHHKLDSARHCTLFSAQGPAINPEQNLESYLNEWSFDLAGKMIHIVSIPGVFAHGRLDPGTRLLLDTLSGNSLADKVDGRILDFGCGAGVIGVALSELNPKAQVTLIDDSALALEATRRTMVQNQVTAELLASDGLTELLDSCEPQYDWIVSNPPYHSGVKQDLQTAQRFLHDCPQALTPEGRLCIVANNHLPYRRWLQELFREVQVISSNREYNVWLARNGARKTT